MPASTSAQQAECVCQFKESPWEAIGTRAACAALMRPGNTSCVIEFGGLGADPGLVKEIIGADPEEYREKVFENLRIYLEALRKKDIETLTDPRFIREAVPIFVRGSMLRTRKDLDDVINQIRQMDLVIVSFFEKFSDKVSEVFKREADPYTAKFQEATFSISERSVNVEYKGTRVVVVFMPEN